MHTGRNRRNGTAARGTLKDSRKNLRRLALFALSLLVPAVASAETGPLTAEEIIRRMERNQVHESARSEGKMLINDRFGRKVITFISMAGGEERSLLEFTSRQERGQKILRTEDELYLYFPDAAEVIRLQGAALRDSVLGSDFSYEDMTGEGDNLEDYEVELIRTEEVEGHSCYKIQMEAKRRSVPYPSQTVWVDTELFVFRKIHKYSLSGKLLKEMYAEEYVQQAGKIIPVHMVMKDTMKRNSSTEFIIEEIDLDADIPDSTFSLEELTW